MAIDQNISAAAKRTEGVCGTTISPNPKLTEEKESEEKEEEK
jgi:hypothetical protein